MLPNELTTRIDTVPPKLPFENLPAKPDRSHGESEYHSALTRSLEDDPRAATVDRPPRPDTPVNEPQPQAARRREISSDDARPVGRPETAPAKPDHDDRFSDGSHPGIASDVVREAVETTENEGPNVVGLMNQNLVSRFKNTEDDEQEENTASVSDETVNIPPPNLSIYLENDTTQISGLAPQPPVVDAVDSPIRPPATIFEAVTISTQGVVDEVPTDIADPNLIEPTSAVETKILNASPVEVLAPTAEVPAMIDEVEADPATKRADAVQGNRPRSLTTPNVATESQTNHSEATEQGDTAANDAPVILPITSQQEGTEPVSPENKTADDSSEESAPTVPNRGAAALNSNLATVDTENPSVENRNANSMSAPNEQPSSTATNRSANATNPTGPPPFSPDGFDPQAHAANASNRGTDGDAEPPSSDPPNGPTQAGISVAMAAERIAANFINDNETDVAIKPVDVSIEAPEVDATKPLPGTVQTQPGAPSSRANAAATTAQSAVDLTENDAPQRIANLVQSALDSGKPMRIRLSPPELGTLQIEVVNRGGAITARLEVQSTAARQTILDSLPMLQEALAQSGTVVERIDVELYDFTADDQPTDPQDDFDQQSEQNEHTEEQSTDQEPDTETESTTADSPETNDQLDVQI